jgi:DNA-binding NtrC family response regulator
MGPRPTADMHLDAAHAVFAHLGADRDLSDTEEARDLITNVPAAADVLSFESADDALVRRIADAAALPELLGRETVAALMDAAGAEAAVIFVQRSDGDPHVLIAAGCDVESARQLARSARQRTGTDVLIEPLGRDSNGPRFVLIQSKGPIGDALRRRVRMLATVAAQGYALCAARDKSATAAIPPKDRSLEPLLPGFLSASAAMGHVVEQIQRLQGSDLTVLITGESGTGKELIARAIHVGSHRSAAMFLPYNCTTTGRELADSQLFGHRRGAFTGAVSDQPGLIRSAHGGTLFLDEIGDLSLDVQPKLLRFLEQSEIMPVGDSRPQRVDVRVLAATNAELEQRVAEGKFREDLYYRLSVIRIHVPPLRERREEIPHLATFFVREACERLGKPDTHLSSEALDVFTQYWWPGNVRQLKNEIQRAVALSVPGSTIEPSQLSAEITTTKTPTGALAVRSGVIPPGSLADAVDQLERDLILQAMERSGGNISEMARALGLTRRGLYLKLRRLGLDAHSESAAGTV